MKKILIAVAGLAVLFVAGLAALAIYFHNESENDANRKRTAAARSSRWPKEETAELIQTKTQENEEGQEVK
jgi:hypothetical protein